MALMPGDPPPWNYIGEWVAPQKAKVLEVALVGNEEYHVIGVFAFMWDARTAAARALLAYRRYWRTAFFEDFPHRPRGTDLKARITSRVVDQYASPWDDR